LRYASGSGFDTWGLVGSLASLTIGALVHLFIQVHRNRTKSRKKGRTPMNGSRKKCNSRNRNRQYAVAAVGAAGAEVFGNQLAS